MTEKKGLVLAFGRGQPGGQRNPLPHNHLGPQLSSPRTDAAFDIAPKRGYNVSMTNTKDTNDFDPSLPTIRAFGQADEFVNMDEADEYVDYDEVSDADADWRDEDGDLDLWDDEDGLASAGFGMDESY